MTALLPCPFCGGAPYENGDMVYCQDCSAEAFTAEWNRRAPVAIDDAMVERAHDYLNRVDRVMVDRSNVRAALEAAMREGEK